LGAIRKALDSINKAEAGTSEAVRPKRRLSDAKAGGRSSNSRFVKSAGASLSLAEEKRNREREEVKRTALEFHQTEIERVKRLANGPDSFPIDQVIEQIEADCDVWRYSNKFTQRLGLDVNHHGRFELESNLELSVTYLQNVKKRAACEIVLWGETLGKTLAEIKSLEEQIHAAVDDAVKAHERQEEAERVEEERYEAAERTRLRQEEIKRAETEEREAERRRQFRKELDSEQDLLPEWIRLAERLAAGRADEEFAQEHRTTEEQRDALAKLESRYRTNQNLSFRSIEPLKNDSTRS
jgi:hypothetical protein